MRRFISLAFDSVGLGDLVAHADSPWPDLLVEDQQHPHKLPAVPMDDIMPVVRLDSLVSCGSGRLPELCVVCLHELEGWEEVRRLSNCRHVFHMRCIDQWVGFGRWTCPLCRAQLFSAEVPAAGTVVSGDGTSDWLYDEYSSFPSPSMPSLLPAQQLSLLPSTNP